MKGRLIRAVTVLLSYQSNWHPDVRLGSTITVQRPGVMSAIAPTPELPIPP